MINKIIKAMKQLEISEYIIREITTESVELFFIKRSLDVRRAKDAHIYEVVVYKEFEKDGKRCKGNSTAGVYPGMEQEEIEAALKSAYLAASFAANPWYELPSYQEDGKWASFPEKPESGLSKVGLIEGAGIMTEALFAEDKAEDYEGTAPFINSAELFVTRRNTHIVSSAGADVSFVKWRVSGEFVVQCKKPQDVETYSDFGYDDLKTDALRDKVRRILAYTKSRTEATKAPKAGRYDVIISGPAVRTIFDYYLDRSAAHFVYADYPHFVKGKNICGSADNEEEGIQSRTDINPQGEGDRITLTLKADVPYSSEAIPMKDRLLIDRGVLQCYHGDARFSYYIGEEPTGHYGDIEAGPGTLPFSEMKKTPYLHIVNFSDFQVESTTGSFGGEIRLAFLYDGEKEIPVTGGSINGKIFEIQKTMRLSVEMQEEDGFYGPFALYLKDISVAGEQI